MEELNYKVLCAGYDCMHQRFRTSQKTSRGKWRWPAVGAKGRIEKCKAFGGFDVLTPSDNEMAKHRDQTSWSQARDLLGTEKNSCC